MTVHYAAVHARNSWRIHSGHDSFESATSGTDGAVNLLRNVGRVGKGMRDRYGPVHAVFVWEEAMAEATAFRLRPGSSNEIETVQIASANLNFKNGLGPSLHQIGSWFSTLSTASEQGSAVARTQGTSKYDPLIRHLAESSREEIVFDFSAIERLLGAQLPESARTHPAWWGNTSADPTHSWANRWTALGWRAAVDLGKQCVAFRKSHRTSDASSTLAGLAPTQWQAIMDLVELAGINVSSWSFASDGHSVDNPRSNGAYCYNWSFGSPSEGFALCLWFANLKEDGDRVFAGNGIRRHRIGLEERLAAPNLNGAQRSRLIQQIRRAGEFEHAVEQSWRRNQALRVIINAGHQQIGEDIEDGPSRVALRSLDDAPWYVHSNGQDFDHWELVRGIKPGADEEDGAGPDDKDDSPGADDLRRLGLIKARRGQRQFREALIGAYASQCAVTRSRIVDLLEAAHIAPHAQGTNYRVSNGLLLRADIHTLFDLHLLSIDDRYRIHLSKLIDTSEYLRYRGAELLALPACISDLPSKENLQARHERFLALEMTRSQAR